MKTATTKKIKINPITLKIEKENARAMIEGYFYKGEQHYGCIFTASAKSKSLVNNFPKWPKLLSIKKSAKAGKYDLSDIGKSLNADNYSAPDKYIAVLDTIYHLKTNSLDFWKSVCTNNLFDIWSPSAPYYSLIKTNHPMILLFRVYEIDYDFSNEIEEDNYYNIIYPRDINLLHPTVPDAYFTEYKKRLNKTIDKNLLKEEFVNSLEVAKK